MNELDELPKGIPLLLYLVASEADALRITRTFKAHLYRSRVIDALYLVVSA